MPGPPSAEAPATVTATPSDVTATPSDVTATPRSASAVRRLAERAGLLALIVAGLVSAAQDRPPPLEPLAALIMEWTPVPLANALLDLLGPAGKPLALVGAAAVALALAGPLATLALRRPLGAASPAVAVALSAALAAPLARPGALAGVVALVGTFWLALAWLVRQRRRRPASLRSAGESVGADPGEDDRADGEGHADGRRRTLLRVAASASALLAVGALPVAAAIVRAAILGRARRPPVFVASAPVPRAAGFDLPGLTPEVTPVGGFYRMSKNVADPVPDAATWSLTVGGRARRTLTLTLDELAALPRVDRYVTMQCVSNPVGGPLWSAALFSGVPLAELLRRAEPLPDARWISFEAPDGHREQLALERAGDPFVLIAYGMNGDWLDPAHGFPARLLATGLYGFRSVKWLTRVELLAAPRPGHWEERGWTAAEVHATARVDVMERAEPAASSGAAATAAQGAGDAGAMPADVPWLAAGVAFAGRRGVSAVEVRVDGGPWQPATLHRPPLSDAMWAQWRAPLVLPPAPGGRTEVRVEARAIDGHGTPQDETPRGQFPNGATGLHGLTVRV